MSSTVLLQIWHDQNIWDESEVDLDGDLVTRMDDAIDMFQNAITALDSGETFTLIANRL